MYRKLFLALFFALQFSNIINSKLLACDSYPYESGIKISKNKKKIIIKSTAEIKVL